MTHKRGHKTRGRKTRKTRRGGTDMPLDKAFPPKKDARFSMRNPALRGYEAGLVAKGDSPLVASLKAKKLLKTGDMGAFDVDLEKPETPGLSKGARRRSKKTTRRR